jgi:hypothetical protein
MPFTVLDCDRKQLLILKRLYLAQLPLSQRMIPLRLAMPLADHLVSDEEIYNEFDGVIFTPQDFS